jgi:hypothetical protein
MLVEIPKARCTISMLSQHFSEAYPEDEIVDISVAYDVSRLTKLDIERENAKRARKYCEK